MSFNSGLIPKKQSLTYQTWDKLVLPYNEEDVDQYFQNLRKSCWNFALAWKRVVYVTSNYD